MPRTNGYVQIAAHYRQQIQDGTLKPGDTMPSFTAVGKQFGVAQTTVNRAYRLLQREGLTVAKTGVGTVVAVPGSNDGAPTGPHTHTELGDCIKLVAFNAWVAAWRQARGDQEPTPHVEAQVNHLIGHGNFLSVALYRHNWRNVNAVLAAFRDAGLAGSSDIAAFYAHVDHVPKPSSKPLPEWCGECDGPEPGRRMVDVPVPEGTPKRVKWCPRCEPRSQEYQAAQGLMED